jgi:hypothetical protein
MSGIHKSAALALPLLAAAIGVAAASAAGGGAAGSGPAVPPGSDTGSFRCEIQAKPMGGMTSLAAVVHANVAMSGSYSFKVASGSRGGSSNINQGGPFAAKAKELVTLGTVSVGPGATYNATLTVTANGATATCSDPVKVPL